MPVRLTESYLRKIIREEVSRVLNEEQGMSFEQAFEIQDADPDSRAGYIRNNPEAMAHAKSLYDSGKNIVDAISIAARERLTKKA